VLCLFPLYTYVSTLTVSRQRLHLTIRSWDEWTRRTVTKWIRIWIRARTKLCAGWQHRLLEKVAVVLVVLVVVVTVVELVEVLGVEFQSPWEICFYLALTVVVMVVGLVEVLGMDCQHP
jgi:uncharacterized membrane protein YhaH (DUF805 family)